MPVIYLYVINHNGYLFVCLLKLESSFPPPTNVQNFKTYFEVVCNTFRIFTKFSVERVFSVYHNLKIGSQTFKEYFQVLQVVFYLCLFSTFLYFYHHSSNLELFTHWPPNQLQKQQNPVTNDLYTFLKHYFKHSPFCIAKCCFPKMVKPLSLIQKNPC